MRNQVFISYSHKDKRWLDELLPFLEVYKQNMEMNIWVDTQIKKGSLWMEEIDTALKSAKAAVLLVTANYLASDFIARKELPPLLAAQKRDGLDILWVAVSASAYNVTDIQDHQCVNDPSRPLDTLSPAKRRVLWNDIAGHIWKTYQGGGGSTGDTTRAGANGEQEEPPDVEPAEGRVVLLYRRNAQPDQGLLEFLEDQLAARGHNIYIDRHVKGGMRWATAISEHLQRAAAVLILLSARSIQSDMLAYEVQLAHGACQRQRGKPRILPLRVAFRDPLPHPFDLLNPIQHIFWDSPVDNPRVLADITGLLSRPAVEPPKYVPPAGGALRPDDPFYIKRPADTALLEAIERGETIILVKGARQMGKTSLLGCGIKHAHSLGYQVVATDFQKLNLSQLASLETFYQSLIEWLSEELDLGLTSEQQWNPKKAPNYNLEQVLRKKILGPNGKRLVWAMDEVERLFRFPYAAEFFTLVRSWHGAVTPAAIGEHLTVMISYATEAHMFITNQNQSPFNVGVPLELTDFTLEQVNLLNEKYRAPLPDWKSVEKFHAVTGGQPFLVRRGLYELVADDPRITVEQLIERAATDGGPFGDHLRRVLVTLARNPELVTAVLGILENKRQLTLEQLYRLRRGGIVIGASPETARVRCRLYEEYLRRHLKPELTPEAVGVPS